MPPGTPSSSRPPSRATTATAQSRVTRLRAAKEPTTSNTNSPAVVKTPGILARSKEGLRLVGEKMKEKEKDKRTVSAPTNYSESLQVCCMKRNGAD
jgi:hypothetical protein